MALQLADVVLLWLALSLCNAPVTVHAGCTCKYNGQAGSIMTCDYNLLDTDPSCANVNVNYLNLVHLRRTAGCPLLTDAKFSRLKSVFVKYSREPCRCDFGTIEVKGCPNIQRPPATTTTTTTTTGTYYQTSIKVEPIDDFD